MQALLMAFNIKPIVKTVNMKKQYFWWDTAIKEILKTSQFLMGLIKSYNEEKIKNIPSKIINSVKKFLKQDDIQPKRVQQASQAASMLLGWVTAVIKVNGALLIVEPKRKELKQSENELKEAQASLSVKQKELQDVMDQVA